MNFETPYQEFIYKRTYAKWNSSKGRRENWDETVSRYKQFFIKRVPSNKIDDFLTATQMVFSRKIMPSMRALWTAGKALDQENIGGFNCSYMVIDSYRRFSELMYILMNGCGVGFSVERQYINQLPEIPSSFIDRSDIKITVNDSREGWALAYQNIIKGLFDGFIFGWDTSLIRPAGATLKTFGGQSSGPEPLERLFRFTLSIFKKASGRKLTSVEVHRICCKIAEIVVAGGTRRSACISLSNPSDERMKLIKSGNFWECMPELSMANISAAWTEKPDPLRFLDEWTSLIRSKTGERGFFNRESAKNWIAFNTQRDVNNDFGCNPCGEVILRPNQFCNLSEIIVKANDNRESLRQKAKFATILGVLQSTLTDFHFIDRSWKLNSEEERLIGVSLTGLRDHEYLKRANNQTSLWLLELKDVVVQTAQEWSKALGINTPAAMTCVKPSGTVSQLVDSSSGLHPRFSPYYVRRVRISKANPLLTFMIDNGFKVKPEIGQTNENANTFILEFPIQSPKSAIMADEVNAIEQLEYYKTIKSAWCEHNASTTIYVKDSEWVEVGAWVYKNWNIVTGITFLPYTDNNYELAPYEEISQEKYDELLKKMPMVDFEKVADYEEKDSTIGNKEFACSGGSCEVN